MEERFANITAPYAEAFNLTFDAFGTNRLFAESEAPSSGHLALSDAYKSALNPAPVTPTTGSGAWELLSGSIIFEFQSNKRNQIKGKAVAVAPGLSLGKHIHQNTNIQAECPATGNTGLSLVLLSTHESNAMNSI